MNNSNMIMHQSTGKEPRNVFKEGTCPSPRSNPFKNLQEPLLSNHSHSPLDLRRKRSSSIRSVSKYDSGCNWWKVLSTVILFGLFVFILDWIVRSGLQAQQEMNEEHAAQ